jgi:glycosyltransferase involved in cell wall biosynthesis
MKIRATSIVWQLVPYIDARLSAAAQHLDFSALVYSGKAASSEWSKRVTRNFAFRLISSEGGLEGGDRSQAMCKALDALAPDVISIQGWSDAASFAAAAWALRHKKGIVIFSESNAYDRKRAWWSEWLKRRVVGVCDAALVGGRDHADYLVDMGLPLDRIAVGHNIVDNSHFAPQRVVESNLPYFLVSNRLVENKNTRGVIEAFAEYRKQTTAAPWNLVILGSGPLEPELRAQIDSLELSFSVRMEGFRKYEDLPALYHGAGAFILASTWEPWGLVVNEAMAAGLPVIVSKSVGSVCELVRHDDNGLIFDSQDISKLTTHLRALAENPLRAAAMGKRSLDMIQDWGPERFGTGLRDAVAIAKTQPRHKSILDRFVVHLLAQSRAISPGKLLANRALRQNRQA